MLRLTCIISLCILINFLNAQTFKNSSLANKLWITKCDQSLTSKCNTAFRICISWGCDNECRNCVNDLVKDGGCDLCMLELDASVETMSISPAHASYYTATVVANDFYGSSTPQFRLLCSFACTMNRWKESIVSLKKCFCQNVIDKQEFIPDALITANENWKCDFDLTSKCNLALKSCLDVCMGASCMSCVRNVVASAECDFCINDLRRATPAMSTTAIEYSNEWLTLAAVASHTAYKECSAQFNLFCNFGCISQSWLSGKCIDGGKCICKNIENTPESKEPKLNILSVENILMDLMGFPKSDDWILIYQGSKDGFSSTDFHKKCDGKSQTLTLIETSSNNLFGGYTSVAWNSNKVWQDDPKAFLVSLRNADNKPVKFGLKKTCTKVIYGFPTSGPIFGNYDFSIGSNGNMNNKSFSFLGECFDANGIVNATSYLAGSQTFRIIDITVYQRIQY